MRALMALTARRACEDESLCSSHFGTDSVASLTVAYRRIVAQNSDVFSYQLARKVQGSLQGSLKGWLQGRPSLWRLQPIELAKKNTGGLQRVRVEWKTEKGAFVSVISYSTTQDFEYNSIVTSLNCTHLTVANEPLLTTIVNVASELMAGPKASIDRRSSFLPALRSFNLLGERPLAARRRRRPLRFLRSEDVAELRH